MTSLKIIKIMKIVMKIFLMKIITIIIIITIMVEVEMVMKIILVAVMIVILLDHMMKNLLRIVLTHPIIIKEDSNGETMILRKGSLHSNLNLDITTPIISASEIKINMIGKTMTYL